jgi:hypothetical protein
MEDCPYYGGDQLLKCETGDCTPETCEGCQNYKGNGNKKKKMRRLRMAGRQGQKAGYTGGVKFIHIGYIDKRQVLIRLGDVESIKTETYQEEQDDKEVTLWRIEVKVMGEDDCYLVTGFKSPPDIARWIAENIVVI